MKKTKPKMGYTKEDMLDFAHWCLNRITPQEYLRLLKSSALLSEWQRVRDNSIISDLEQSELLAWLSQGDIVKVVSRPPKSHIKIGQHLKVWDIVRKKYPDNGQHTGTAYELQLKELSKRYLIKVAMTCWNNGTLGDNGWRFELPSPSAPAKKTKQSTGTEKGKTNRVEGLLEQLRTGNKGK